MKRSYFGTDGVRGPYGGPVINTSFARRLGSAAGRWLAASGGRTAGENIVLIGRDTRFSGAALEQAVARGLGEAGWSPWSLGILPTPAVARAVRAQQAALGVVITASHNPASDNGIKFFGPTGIKLTDEEEEQIERQLQSVTEPPGAEPGDTPLCVMAEAASDYIQAVSGLLPPASLRGWNIVLDTANGATCATSPAVLRTLGASVVGVGDSPDGHNINAGVGSEHPEAICAAVRDSRAQLGIAHDGDGDRCILCDERGQVLDGDEIMTMLALHALQQGKLAKNTLVVTVQSNLGVDAAVLAAGGRVLRTSVGDRYVSERMLAKGAALGGESSGHIICAEVSMTGDGLVAALKVIEVMLATGKPLSELRRALKKFPQLTSAITIKEKRPLETLPAVQAAIRASEADLAEHGRVMVRYSGTEPKIRLLVEGEDATQVRVCLDRLATAVSRDLDVV